MADQQSWVDPGAPVPEQVLIDRSRFSERHRTQVSRLEPRVAATDLSIIIPTRNEAGNIAQLLRRLEPVVRTRSVEIIFVDDSTDETPQTIDAAAGSYARPIRLIHRLPEQRTGGLGGAVLEGMRAARGHWLIVMDGDCQHPPELIPQLLQDALDESSDLVVASRYSENGSASSFSLTRSLFSKGSTWAAKAFFPGRLRNVSDPMSGFFLVRRGALDLATLQPNGFKILLEIVARTPNLRISSVPFQFGERYAGESKASLREGIRFLNLLLSLRFGPRFTKFSQFGLVGVSGLLVNSLLLAFWTETAGLYYMLSLVLATQGSSLWNFFLSEYWVFKRVTNHRGSQLSRGAMFLAMNNVALLARGPMVFLFTSFLGVNYLISNVASMAVLLLIRYAVADSLIWKLGPAEAVVASATLPVSPQEQEATS
jgi:dolichol-phosphate mannosyltransferase